MGNKWKWVWDDRFLCWAGPNNERDEATVKEESFRTEYLHGGLSPVGGARHDAGNGLGSGERVRESGGEEETNLDLAPAPGR